jgi:hypothetical protein
MSGAIIGTAGFAAVAVSPQWTVAAAGFALMGLGLSVMVPLTFSAADALDPAGTGTVIAKVNLFNYGGVIIGSAVIGIVGGLGGTGGEDYPNLRVAFAVPAVLVLLSAALAPAFRVVDAARAAAREAASLRAEAPAGAAAAGAGTVASAVD